ncbi:hypothetical protein DDONNNOJ_00033 [Citrobacter phage BSwS KMM3]|nr:hypothetical protein DDONNNOJ_00033 [Citrobacter phage BSwS KMM3]
MNYEQIRSMASAGINFLAMERVNLIALLNLEALKLLAVLRLKNPK